MKKFLTTFSALVATFGASASVSKAPVDPVRVQDPSREVVLQNQQDPTGIVSVKDSAGNIFDFVLKRTETGELMARHGSHSSHSSHSSHASHASHFSSRY
jgi:hypothetical protein